MRCGSGWNAEDSDLEVFDIGDDGLEAELSGNPVDGYECRWKRCDELQDVCETCGLL